MGVLCTEYPFPQNPDGFYRGPMGRARSRLKNRHKKRSTCEKSQVLHLIYTLLLNLTRVLFEMCLFLFCAYCNSPLCVKYIWKLLSSLNIVASGKGGNGTVSAGGCYLANTLFTAVACNENALCFCFTAFVCVCVAVGVKL